MPKATAKKRGRKPKGAQSITLRFKKNILTAVDKAAKKATITRTEFLEIAAEEKLARDSAPIAASRN